MTDRTPLIRVTAMPSDTNPYGGVFGGWLMGLVLSAIAAGVVASVVLTAIWAIGGAEGAQLSDVTIGGLLSQVVFFGGIAAGALVVFFAPITVAMARLHSERSWLYPALGLLLGFVLALFTPGPPEQFVDPQFYFSMLAFGGLPGAVAGFVWWCSYRKARAQLAGVEAPN